MPHSSVFCQAFALAANAACSETATSKAAASPAMPGTFSVPERWRRSCPPPFSSGAGAKAGLRTIAAPTPFGPPNLCAEKNSTSASFSSRSGRRPTACTASQISPAPFECTVSAISAVNWTAPVSLFAACTAATEPGDSAASSASRSSEPSSKTGMTAKSAGVRGEVPPHSVSLPEGREDPRITRRAVLASLLPSGRRTG